MFKYVQVKRLFNMFFIASLLLRRFRSVVVGTAGGPGLLPPRLPSLRTPGARPAAGDPRARGAAVGHCLCGESGLGAPEGLSARRGGPSV